MSSEENSIFVIPSEGGWLSSIALAISDKKEVEKKMIIYFPAKILNIFFRISLKSFIIVFNILVLLLHC